MKIKLSDSLSMVSATIGVIDHFVAWTDKWAKAVFPGHEALAATGPGQFGNERMRSSLPIRRTVTELPDVVSNATAFSQ